MSLIETKDLRVYFPIHGGLFRRTTGYVKAVQDITLSLGESEILGVVGESGCGKSTLGNAILGLVQPTQGSLKLFGDEVNIHKASSWNAYRSDLQVIFQDPYSSLNPRHTVFEILSEPMIVHNVCSRADAKDRVAELLKKVGMPADAMKRFPHAFSGGQRQRIGIARAVGLNPKVIVCDEVTSALDVSVQAQIVELLLHLRDTMKLSYIFITHDLALVRTIADRVAVMYAGRIVEQAPADDLFSNPAHPYTVALMKAIPVLDRSKRPQLLEGEVASLSSLPEGCVFHPRCYKAKDDCKLRDPELKETGKRKVACYYPEADL